MFVCMEVGAGAGHPQMPGRAAGQGRGEEGEATAEVSC